MINLSKVVSKSFFSDIVARFQNFFGMNLTVYESMIDKGMKQIQDDLKAKGIRMKWYRCEITQLTNGAVAIMLYGDEA